MVVDLVPGPLCKVYTDLRHNGKDERNQWCSVPARK